MRNIVGSDKELCVGCNRCVRECPVEMANITYLDEEGALKVRVEPSRCIACGACIAVCEHGARFYEDDLELFLADLASGEPISLLAAPSIRTNFPEWRRLFTWLRSLGVRHVYDVSLGADICIWAHLRHLERAPSRPLITQPCPPIVSYCEIQRQELLPYLSPVQSPMACAAVYMRTYMGITGTIAALSPCIAKSNEFTATGLIRHNITFAKLREYIAAKEIVLPERETGFDHHEAGLGKIFPIPGGLQANIEFFTGENLCLEKSGVRAVYAGLDEYAATEGAVLPDIFDVLNCEEGCILGTGCVHPQNPFAVRKAMDSVKRSAVTPENAERHRQVFAAYDRMLNLDDFYREYKPVPEHVRTISEEEINDVFVLMGKDTFAKQNFNCGACGSDSCRDMARKVALGINLPINCIIRARDDAEQGRRRNAEYMSLVHRTGETLLAAGRGESFIAAVKKTLRVLGETVKGEAATLWRRKEIDGVDAYIRTHSWFKDAEMSRAAIRGDWPAEWIALLKDGNYIQNHNAPLSGSGRLVFPEPIRAILVVPIHLHGDFWGFMVVLNARERLFSKEEVALVDASGVLVVSSILEQELTESLVSAREEALAGARAKSDFLSRMSHEMRTPLNAIIGMAKIADRTPDTDKLCHCLATIKTSSAYLLGLINDVLDMAKIEAGKLELVNAPFVLEAMLSGVCDIIRDLATKKKQILRIEMQGKIRRRYIGDSLRLSQVVANLLSNAVKFTPEGGEIVLTVAEVSAQADTCTLRFTVSDTGIGITEEQAARLFTAFEQAGAETAATFGGTGLGLAIAKNIVERMNGFIDVRPTPGNGATFFFEVSLEPAEDVCTCTKDATLRAMDFSGVTLLLVEDIALNREIFCTLLEDTGITIDMAENGEQAVALFAANPDRYSMVVMDIQMPVMDGYTACRTIRALNLPGAASIPIVAMTANAFTEDIERGRECGMNGHLTKPIDEAALRETIARHAGMMNAG